jgi:hypothetical protein
LVMQMFEEIKAAGLKQLMFMFQGQGWLFSTWSRDRCSCKETHPCWRSCREKNHPCSCQRVTLSRCHWGRPGRISIPGNKAKKWIYHSCIPDWFFLCFQGYWKYSSFAAVLDESCAVTYLHNYEREINYSATIKMSL